MNEIVETEHNEEPYLVVHKNKTIEQWFDYFLCDMPSPKDTGNLIAHTTNLSKLLNESTRYYNETMYYINDLGSKIEEKRNSLFAEKTADKKAAAFKITAVRKEIELEIGDSTKLLEDLVFEKNFWLDIRDTLKTQITILTQASILTSHNRKLTESTI